jgi:myo-inositol-1-phosphate synthase
MREDIGGYKAENIEFVCGFDIDERKVNTPLGEALKQRPNSAYDIVEKIKSKAPVYEGPVIDGYALLMDAYPEKDRFLVSEKLRNSSEMNRVSWTKKKENDGKKR